MKYKISVKAGQDIENIWFFTKERWSIVQADKYFSLLYNEVEKLAEYPLSGRDCSHIRENYRYSKVKSHYIGRKSVFSYFLCSF